MVWLYDMRAGQRRLLLSTWEPSDINSTQVSTSTWCRRLQRPVRHRGCFAADVRCPQERPDYFEILQVSRHEEEHTAKDKP